MLKYIIAFFVLGVASKANAYTILSDAYSGPVNYCPTPSACTPMTQDVLSFTGDGQFLSLSASLGQFFELSYVSSSSSVLAPRFSATLTEYDLVTITGYTGQGFAEFYVPNPDPCASTPLTSALCSEQINAPFAFTFGVPFLLTFTAELSIIPDSGQAGISSGNVSEDISFIGVAADTNGNTANSVITIGSADPTPEPASIALLGLGLIAICVRRSSRK